jgi:hypothetical protein
VPSDLLGYAVAQLAAGGQPDVQKRQDVPERSDVERLSEGEKRLEFQKKDQA